MGWDGDGDGVGQQRRGLGDEIDERDESLRDERDESLTDGVGWDGVGQRRRGLGDERDESLTDERDESLRVMMRESPVR